MNSERKLFRRRRLQSNIATATIASLVLIGSLGGYAYGSQSSKGPWNLIPFTSMAVPTSLSCSSPKFCVVTTDTGHALIFDGRSWSESGQLAAMLMSISCPTAGYCVAVEYPDGSGLDSGLIKLQGGRWSHPYLYPGTQSLNSVSCSSNTYCVGADGNGGVSVFNGNSWTSRVQVDGLGNPDLTDTGFVSISCSKLRFCAGVDNNGGVVVYRNGKWGTPVALTAAPSDPSFDVFRTPQSISCFGVSFCATGDQYGNAYVFNGTSWKTFPKADSYSFNTVSCPTRTLCLAGDGGTSYSSLVGRILKFNGTHWAPPSQKDGNGQYLDVSCSSATFCLGIDASGTVFRLVG